MSTRGNKNVKSTKDVTNHQPATDPKEQPIDVGDPSEGAAAPSYTKQQFLGSARYAESNDVLSALLQDDEAYTADQVDQLLKEFLEKEAE